MDEFNRHRSIKKLRFALRFYCSIGIFDVTGSSSCETAAGVHDRLLASISCIVD